MFTVCTAVYFYTMLFVTVSVRAHVYLLARVHACVVMCVFVLSLCISCTIPLHVSGLAKKPTESMESGRFVLFEDVIFYLNLF